MASKLRVDSILPVDGAPTNGGGGIIQVQSVSKTDTSSFTSGTPTDIPSLSVSITPKFSTSKILLMTAITFGYSTTNTDLHVRFLRDSTPIFIGDSAGSRTSDSYGFQHVGHNFADDRSENVSLTFLDSPSTTSAVTYKVQVETNRGGTIYVNRTHTDTDDENYNRSASSLTVMEVSA